MKLLEQSKNLQGGTLYKKVLPFLLICGIIATLCLSSVTNHITTVSTKKLEGLRIFNITKVEMRGNFYISSKRIMKELELSRSRSVWNSFSNEEKKLSLIPGVGDVRIDRRLPHTLVVSVREDAPVAWVFYKHEWHIVSSSAEIYKPSRITQKDRKLPVINQNYKSNGQSITNVEARNAVYALTNIYNKNFQWNRRIREVIPVHATYYSIRLEGYKDVIILLPVSLNDQRGYLLEASLEDFNKRFAKTAKPKIIDLRYNGQIVINFQNISPPEVHKGEP